MSELTGLYAGIVEENQDPEQLGRVKVRVPHVYGYSGGQAVGTDDLPWAVPAGLPAGGEEASGGVSWLPEPGDQVLVMFLDAQPEKPVWLWAMQNQSQAKTAPFHSYYSDPAYKGPRRAALTRYGHTVEFNQDYVLVGTKDGNSYLFDDAGQAHYVVSTQDITIWAGNEWSVEAAKAFFLVDDFAINANKFAALIDERVVWDVGQSFSIMAGGAVHMVMDGEEGAFTLIDLAGSTFNLDGTGNVAAANTAGATMALQLESAILSYMTSSVYLTADGIQLIGPVISLDGTVKIGSGMSGLLSVPPTDPIACATETTIAINGIISKVNALILAYNTHVHHGVWPGDTATGITGVTTPVTIVLTPVLQEAIGTPSAVVVTPLASPPIV